MGRNEKNDESGGKRMGANMCSPITSYATCLSHIVKHGLKTFEGKILMEKLAPNMEFPCRARGF